MNFIKKWLTVPKSNETRLAEAIALWEVRWESRYGPYYSEVQPEMEVFTSENEAFAFAEALKNAFRLTKTTSGNKVHVKLRN